MAKSVPTRLRPGEFKFEEEGERGGGWGGGGRQKKEEEVLILNKSIDRIFSTFLGRLASWCFGPLEIFHD